MIQTDKEVVEQLKLLRADEKPLPEDARFSELIWAKVENSPQRIFAFNPVYGLAALSAVLFLLFWTYYLPSQQKGDRFGEPVPFFSSVPIVGAVLETSGDFIHTSSPLMGEDRGGGENAELPPILTFPHKGGRDSESIIEEGDLLATGSESRMTFFLPGVGYFHLAPNSKVQLKRARHIVVPGTGGTGSQYTGTISKGAGFSFKDFKPNLAPLEMVPNQTHPGYHYELFLEEGGLYSRLSKFESGTTLNYLTHFGTARVSGTDLLLNVEKDSGLSVEVLNGEVMVASPKEPDDYKNVKEGFSALISPNMSGTLLITELEGPRLAELKEEFTQIFEGSRGASERDQSKFRIVDYRELK